MRQTRTELWPKCTLQWVKLGCLALIFVLVGCQTGPPPTPLSMGEVALREGRLEQADAYFEQAATVQPDRRAAALHGRARVAVAMKHPEQALHFYRGVSRADANYFRHAARADYAVALVEAGRQRLARERNETAVRALRAAWKIEPSFRNLDRTLASALSAWGQELTMHGQRTEAIVLFKESIEVRPTEADGWVGAAEILIAQGERQQAIALLGDARRHLPVNSRIRALTVQAMGVY